MLYNQLYGVSSCVVAAKTGFKQILHLQPGPHFIPFFTQLQQQMILQHDQLQNSNPTHPFIATWFSTDT